MKIVLFLYSEISPYLISGVERLVRDNDVQVHMVRWPVNSEAPFQFKDVDNVTIHERADLDEAALRRLAKELRPDVVFASGWIDKAYLRVCRDARKRGVPTVMCSDPSWRGSLRQWAAVAAARFWIGRTYSHAWVPGAPQAEYAVRLGIKREAVKLGFYTADMGRFAHLAEQFKAGKTADFPHRFLCVARYIPCKGHRYMLEAFTELCDAGEAGDWELWCIGSGELLAEAIQHPRVKHLGFVQSDEVWKYMEQCGAFVLASTYEAWGVVVHEHAAAGFPLLLSDAVGARERFLQEGRNGWGFKAGDKESLKDAFRHAVATSDDGLLKMGMHSAELGSSWGPSQWADVVMELIDEGHA